MKLTIGGTEIHYIIEGGGDRDILLLHGWGSSLDVWAHIAKHLSGRFRLISLDFPGCGKSGMPKNPLTLEDYGELTLEFIKKAGLNAPVFVGHSHGGRVILYLAGQGKINPGKIVLFDSAGIKPKKTMKQKLRLYSFKTIRLILTMPVIKNHTGRLLEKARAHFGSADYKSAPEVMRKTLVNLVNTDLRDILPCIKASTLLIWGENDPATPLSDAKLMEKGIADCGLCVINGAGHYSFLEAPAQVNGILDSFLGGKQ